MQHPNVELCPVDQLKPYANNARTHSKKQIEQIARSIERFGFTNPVLVGEGVDILAGHGRVAAAKELGISEVPVIRLSHLNEAEKRAYILADNKLAENAGWDNDLLSIELQGLLEIDFDMSVVGFDTVEIDYLLDGGTGAETVPADDRLDIVNAVTEGPSVTRSGDLWSLGDHRLICGDANNRDHIRALCKGVDGQTEPIAMLFTDPPYNVPIDGHVSGLGQHKHREFAEGSGEMSSEEFTAFLRGTLDNAASVLNDGAIAYVCMDWRHIRELLDAGEAVFDALKNLCVWNKTNAGMGSFYRSKHELVFVFKKGTKPHINNFGLGDKGRYRTNVWDYAGINSFSKTRDEELAIHPTVKPVNLIADAIRDCSHRGDVILDIFGGSGSTLIAAEEAGRKARVIEIDPQYCDAIINRWQNLTGKDAVLIRDGCKEREVRDATNSRHLQQATEADKPQYQGSFEQMRTARQTMQDGIALNAQHSHSEDNRVNLADFSTNQGGYDVKAATLPTSGKGADHGS